MESLLRNEKLYKWLEQVDRELAQLAVAEGCWNCVGKLHRGDYERKLRAGWEGGEGACVKRFSFCCAKEGCRKRTTPPSVRFLGRKVYLGAVVVLVAAMRQGTTPRRVRELSKLFGADRRTIARWQTFWRERFPQTRFWKVARALLVPAVEVAVLPRALVEAFLRDGDPCQGWGRLLQFLAPITVAGGLDCKVFR